MEPNWTGSHIDEFDLENVDGGRESPAVVVDDVRVKHRGRGHVVREHVHQQVHVAELGRQGAPHHVVGARHALLLVGLVRSVVPGRRGGGRGNGRGERGEGRAREKKARERGWDIGVVVCNEQRERVGERGHKSPHGLEKAKCFVFL